MAIPLLEHRETLHSGLSPQAARSAIDELLAEGIAIEDRHHRVYGWRAGDRFSFSLGVPVLSGRPVLRGRLVEAGPGTEVRVSVGPRAEHLVTVAVFGTLLATGAVIQVGRALLGIELPEGGRVQALADLLPGIAFMAALFGIGAFVQRRFVLGHAPFLVAAVAAYVAPESAGDGAGQSPPPPLG